MFNIYNVLIFNVFLGWLFWTASQGCIRDERKEDEEGWNDRRIRFSISITSSHHRASVPFDYVLPSRVIYVLVLLSQFCTFARMPFGRAGRKEDKIKRSNFKYRIAIDIFKLLRP